MLYELVLRFMFYFFLGFYLVLFNCLEELVSIDMKLVILSRCWCLNFNCWLIVG